MPTKGKKLKMYVDRDGTLIIKAPRYTHKKRIEQFVMANRRWIEQKQRQQKSIAEKGAAPTEQQLKDIKKSIAAIMKNKTEHYSAVIGVTPASVKITSAKHRWGSCRKGPDGLYSICYSYRNYFLSDRCQDYVVVHELCHIKHMNHSKAFYSEIEKILPDYRRIEKEISSYPGYDLYPVPQK